MLIQCLEVLHIKVMISIYYNSDKGEQMLRLFTPS